MPKYGGHQKYAKHEKSVGVIETPADSLFEMRPTSFKIYRAATPTTSRARCVLSTLPDYLLSSFNDYFIR